MARERILSENLTRLDNKKRLKSILGKKVYSKRGEIVGTVVDVLTNNSRYVGILVNSKRKIFIDKDYIQNDAEDSVILSIEPVTQLIGKEVIDCEGKRLGKVIDVSRPSHKNDYAALIVKKSIISGKKSIPKREVAVAQKNIILNTAYDIRTDYDTKI